MKDQRKVEAGRLGGLERQRRRRKIRPTKLEASETARAALREALRPFISELERGGTVGSALECMESRNWEALITALLPRGKEL